MFRVVCRHKIYNLIVLLLVTGPKNKNHHKSTKVEDDSVTRRPFLLTRETAVRLNRTIAKKKKKKKKSRQTDPSLNEGAKVVSHDKIKWLCVCMFLFVLEFNRKKIGKVLNFVYLFHCQFLIFV